MTDEQRMREQFEEAVVAEHGIGAIDTDPETTEYTRRSTYEAWGWFSGGWQARDAEVQQLRQALEQIRDAPWPRNDHAEFSENLQEIARAAIARAEGGGS